MCVVLWGFLFVCFLWCVFWFFFKIVLHPRRFKRKRDTSAPGILVPQEAVSGLAQVRAMAKQI